MKAFSERIETEQALSAAILRAGRHAREALQSGPLELVVKKAGSKRSEEQNRLMWAALGDIARQVLWPVDGKESKLDAEEWKHVLSAGLKRHQRVAAGIDGGFVILGQRTSRMTVREMTELIEIIHAFGSQRGVIWSDPEFQSLMQAEQARAAA
jgi:hypothetical protein